MNKTEVIICFGTRPEIIKLAPIIKLVKNKKVNYKLIFSGQHYSKNMSKIFFKQFGINKIHYDLNFKKNEKKAISFEKFFFDKAYKIFINEKPKIVIVQGDTKTCLISAMAANATRQYNQKIKIFHIEAGLRSYDYSMPEELNRVIVDHLSDYLFPPTKIQEKILKKEKIKKRIIVVGSTLSDNLKNRKIKNLNKNFFLLTIHRFENVSSKKKLSKILDIINFIADRRKIKIIFPVHPNTYKKIVKYGIRLNKKYVDVVKPLNYEKFLVLVKNAKIILSDSGGIQEEACILKTPHITLRENTERPETLQIKSNYLISLNKKKINELISKLSRNKFLWEDPYGRNVSSKIFNHIKHALLS